MIISRCSKADTRCSTADTRFSTGADSLTAGCMALVWLLVHCKHASLLGAACTSSVSIACKAGCGAGNSETVWPSGGGGTQDVCGTSVMVEFRLSRASIL